MAALVAYRGLTLTENIDDYPEGIILPVDKPYRWTSADVIRKVKYQAIKHFHKKNLKVGHAGTLDPLATGDGSLTAYEDVMRRNLEVLKEALGGER